LEDEMAIEPNLVSEQLMEVEVAGPDDANTMYLATGLARFSLTASQAQTKKENFAVHVGPSLSVEAFRRSIATVSLAQVRFHDYSPADADIMRWEIEEVDADFDDEAEKVELRFTLEVQASTSSATSLQTVSYWVGILAAMPSSDGN
jgi:hypothetical protein